MCFGRLTRELRNILMARIPSPQRVSERMFLEKDVYFSSASHESLGNHLCMIRNIVIFKCNYYC